MSEIPAELDLTVITITVDSDGRVSLDSDVGEADTVRILEECKLMAMHPEWFTDEEGMEGEDE